jgi:hypothetical protein
LADFWENAGLMGAFVILAPLLYCILLVVVFLGSLDWGAGTPASNQLDRLIQLKHQGMLLHRSLRQQASPAASLPGIPSASRSGMIGPLHSRSYEEMLDRLLRLKRRLGRRPRK